MQRLVRHHRQFEVDSLLHRQPMKLSEHWSDVVTSTSSSDEPCCRVLYRLQPLDQRCHTAERPNESQEEQTLTNSVCLCASVKRLQ